MVATISTPFYGFGSLQKGPCIKWGAGDLHQMVRREYTNNGTGLSTGPTPQSSYVVAQRTNTSRCSDASFLKAQFIYLTPAAPRIAPWIRMPRRTVALAHIYITWTLESFLNGSSP